MHAAFHASCTAAYHLNGAACEIDAEYEHGEYEQKQKSRHTDVTAQEIGGVHPVASSRYYEGILHDGR